MTWSLAPKDKVPQTGTGEPAAPSDSARGSIVAGVVILLVFFGGLGSWALTAPLNSAVVGEGVVKVEGNRKTIQHLDGGIVRDLLVSEGDRVAAGQVLMVLDDTEISAEHDILTRQRAILLATGARLQSELAGDESMTLPAELAGGIDEPVMRNAFAAQQQEFASRRAALAGEVSILERRAAQLSEQIAGNQAQAEAYREQLASVREERQSLEDLFAQGIVAKPRLLQLERTATGLEGQIASVVASIAGARETLTEYSRQIEQVRKARLAEVTAALSEVQSRLLDIEPRLRNAEAVLDRMEVRTPYAGEVVDLAVHSVGAVIVRGERLLDIVPERSSLVVEARVGVGDIAEVHPGMTADVHFTSYKQRIIPLIHGVVRKISADRLADQRTGESYYLAEVEVDAEELAASPNVRLYPGMPATVMITTQERTAFDYIVGPLAASFDRSFRQR